MVGAVLAAPVVEVDAVFAVATERSHTQGWSLGVEADNLTPTAGHTDCQGSERLALNWENTQ
jgi:hypothetical protein